MCNFSLTFTIANENASKNIIKLGTFGMTFAYIIYEMLFYLQASPFQYVQVDISEYVKHSQGLSNPILFE